MSAREADVLHDSLLALSPQGLVWRNNKGAGRLVDRQGRTISQWISFGGPDGAADIIGTILVPGSRWGIPLAVETKSVTGRQSKEQRIFGEAWTRAGGLYVLARSAADAVTQIKDATRDPADRR